VSSLDFLGAAARQASVLNEIGHRPWPLPDRPWTQAQTWEDLLFAHWRVAPAELERLLPPELPLDTFDGAAWLGITPFRLTNLRLRGTPPLPWVSTFPELNVRTYATLDGRPGIWFFTLDAASALAVEAAKRVYRLPYHRARMTVERLGDDVHYESARVGATFSGRYRPDGAVFIAERGTLEHFLTERYCLYTGDGGRLYRAEIHHPPWPLQPASATIDLNTMAPVELPDQEPHLLFAARQDVVVWALEEVAA
jgi:uncharacterized protein YqjF (DUF2071 family)